MAYPLHYSSNTLGYQTTSGYSSPAATYGNTQGYRLRQAPTIAQETYGSVAMASHQRNLSSQSYSSHDSGYGSEPVASTGPLPQAPDPSTSNTGGYYRYAESSHHNTHPQYQDTQTQRNPPCHETQETSSYLPSRLTDSSSKKSKSPSSRTAMYGPKTKQHVCLYSHCEYTTTRPYDLTRHQATHGSDLGEQLINCPDRWCGRYGKHENGNKGGFPLARLDHFREHVRKLHHKEVVKDAEGRLWVKDAQGRSTRVEYEGVLRA